MMDFTSTRRATACLAIAALLSSCSKGEHLPQMSEPVAAKMVSEMRMPEAVAPAPAPPTSSVTEATKAQQMGSSTITYTDSERKFIRTASVSFRVKDVYISALAIEDIVAAHGGFVVKNDISADAGGTQSHSIGNGKLSELTQYTVQGNLIVRVPSARTQEFLRAIVSQVEFLDKRNFSARDAQFDLLRQQLEVMRNQEAQSDMGDAVKDGGKLAHKTDAIAERNEFKAARDEAHIAKKEFEDQVAFSTTELHLYQHTKLVKTEREDIDSLYRDAGPGFFSRMGDALVSGWRGLLEFSVALAGIWPALLILGGFAWMVRWLLNRRRARKALAAK